MVSEIKGRDTVLNASIPGGIGERKPGLTIIPPSIDLVNDEHDSDYSGDDDIKKVMGHLELTGNKLESHRVSPMLGSADLDDLDVVAEGGPAQAIPTAKARRRGCRGGIKKRKYREALLQANN